jgi:alpha-L-fucosidase 2
MNGVKFYLIFFAFMQLICATATGKCLIRDTLNKSGKLILWYQLPAKAVGKPPGTAMNETLPIGNGRIGALIFGGTARERLVLNDVSLWTGDENTEGSYQALANVYINLPGHNEVSNYRRDLDLRDAVSHVNYTANGVNYQREYFASNPAQLIIVRLTANKPGAYTGSIALDDMHNTATIRQQNRLTAVGTLDNGLQYESRLIAINDGGTLKTANGQLVFNNCNSITLLIAAGTSYIFNYDKKYMGQSPQARIDGQIAAALSKPYNILKSAHIKDFQSLFNRVSINLGNSAQQQIAMPTGARKVAAASTTDPELEALLFQYGRYLLISCSRQGGLAANLQGLWNDSNNAAWGSDYHDNINVEMNYWPAEPGNMAECALPFFQLIQSQLVPWRKATAAAKEINTPSGEATKRGFALRTSHNIYGHSDWNWDKTANAWYCQQLWEHYAFGLDKNYLKTVAYPIMKETCEFWEDHLKTLPDGRLVVPDGWSPEHGPVEDGVSYNQQIVWDLFNNYADATAALDTDAAYGAKITAMRDKLVGPVIGKWGQIQEWMTDKDDPNDHHRHTSNLFAVYPGRQISATKTPALAKAAKVSLDARGPTGDVREWSFAWRTALYARLHDATDAYAMFKQFFSDHNSCLNLFGLHPPMQMDGNFGITAAITEMLMQSHEGEINLLPALPANWPTGSVSGLRARGGFTVDMTWANNKLISATIHNVNGTTCKLRYRNKLINVDLLKKGAEKIFDFKDI